MTTARAWISWAISPRHSTPIALTQRIAELGGILPICAGCKKIRTEGAGQGGESWVPIETYLTRKTETQFSHSICPDCMKRLYPDLQE